MAVGITFDETMTGHFALGSHEPRAGAAAGRKAGSQLAMNATVKIADLEAFLTDSKHRGQLTGSIDFDPFGRGIPASAGAFHLFSPSPKAGLKHMVYELGFRHDGKDHYLAGRKQVHDGVGFDIWSDTTTLFTTLHAGSNAKAPVIGAGILRLDMGDFLRLMSTIKVTGSKSAKERAATAAKFGRFFMGELWNTYGPAT